MIEQDLATCIKAAIEALSIEGLTIFGNMLPAPAGKVAGEERPADKVTASIRVEPRSTTEFGWLCPLDFKCAIGLAFRADVYPRGATDGVCAVCGAVFDMVTTWVREIDGVGPGSALETDTFTPGGIRLDGGIGPEFDKDDCAWYASLTFTVRGRTKTQ